MVEQIKSNLHRISIEDESQVLGVAAPNLLSSSNTQNTGAGAPSISLPSDIHKTQLGNGTAGVGDDRFPMAKPDGFIQNLDYLQMLSENLNS